MKAQVSQFVQKLGDALNETVARAGRGTALQDAINEYRASKQVQSTLKGAAGVAGAASVEEMARRGLKKMLGK
jgi:hypothetical protein